MSESHEVSVMCRCDDVEHCQMERYIADVRTAVAEIEALARARTARKIWFATTESASIAQSDGQ